MSSRSVRWSLLVAVALLLLVGVFTPEPQRELTATSFGTVPYGYGALFDLLAELQLPVARSYAPPERLATDATVWWIAPEFLGHPGTPIESWQGGAWIEAGGAAVIFLPDTPQAIAAFVEGVAVPARTAPEDDSQAEPSDKTLPVEPRKPPTLIEQIGAGDVTPRPRRLDAPRLRVFEDAGDWRVAATVDGRPFVLARAVGSGRLVLVADAAIVRNAWLDHADVALFVVDLVRAFGVPRFDEREHGLRAEQSASRYLATSPALPVLLGLALVGVLLAWRGTALPLRTVSEVDTSAPVLETFVSSLAGLYARTGDYARVLEQYRELTAARLRRHFGLPPETPRALLVDRLRSTRGIAATAVGVLLDGSTVSNEAGLRAAVRSLDTLVAEVVQ